MRKEQFKVKAPTKLIIGDPMYLEAIENKTDKGREKGITFIRKKMPKEIETTIIIKEIDGSYEIDNDEFSFILIIVKIIGISNKYSTESKNKLLDVFAEEKYHPNLVKTQGDLGCDTASFVMETDLGYEKFHTGADGYYGCYMTYKDNLAYNIELSFDIELFDFDEVVKTMKCLFKEI